MGLVSRQGLALAFVFGTLLFLFYLAGRMLAPFSSPGLAALTAVIVCYPLHRRVVRWMKGRSPSFQALTTIGLVFFFLIVPLAFIVSATVSEARAVLPEVQSMVQAAAGRARGLLNARRDWRERLPARLVEHLESGSEDLEQRLQGVAEGFVGWVAASATSLARDILRLLVDSALFVFFLFFLFRDGEDMYRYVSGHLPMTDRLRGRVVAKIQETVIGVVRGSVVTGLLQGLLAMIGYALLGARAAVLLGCMTAVAGFVPIVGTALIWVPVCCFYLLAGSFGKAVFLLAWGLMLGGVDNVIRPFVVGSQFQMPFFWLTLALLGGLSVFGVLGLLIGPLAFALLPIFLEFYREHAMESSKDS
ncbi:MAG TPA: hypothetical protein DCM05_05460 [Elusimicrobia bacterium]|nr:hypothetical protein [Elusimicrobiota bacterium]